MAKLLEKDGAQMAAALVSIAIPLKRFVDDEEFVRVFRESTQKGVANNLTSIITIYADLVPLLFGDKHLKDTLSILAVIEGKTVKELLKMNGTEMIADAMLAWKEQIAPFFLRLGVSVGGTQL